MLLACFPKNYSLGVPSLSDFVWSYSLKGAMTMNLLLRAMLSVALVLAVPVVARADYGPTDRIGPSGAEVAGAIAGAAGAATLILYFVLRSPSITGCVQSIDASMTLVNEKDNHAYALTGNIQISSLARD